MRCFFSIVLISLVALTAVAQDAVVSCGGTVKGDNGEVSYSVGQPVVLYAEDDVTMFLAGVQQQSDFVKTYVPVIEKDGLEVSVFPNPVRDVLTVRCETAGEDNPFVVRLYDERGALAGQYAVKEPEVRIDMGGMPAGVYMLAFVDVRGAVRRYVKVVKVL